jgi:putative ABC transport system permease protein
VNYAQQKFRFAVTMAWRETRAAAGKFIFVVLAVALGTAALTAVSGFNESVRYTLLSESRTLMAADISLRMPVEPSEKEMAFLEELGASGISSTRVTETVSMASPGTGERRTPVLVSVKGADFAQYPFYGQLLLDPLNTRLDTDSVAVSDDLLLRLNVRIGDDLRIGERSFRIVARIWREPDRMTTGFTLGPRVLFTREGIRDAGIIVPNSRITERVLLKLPPEHDLENVRASIESVFGRRARVTDYTESNPTLTRALNRSTRFLSLVSLIALIVAGLGVGATMQSHLRQKMGNIAFMKCIGGRAEHILRIYLTQALLLGLVGSVVGVLMGAFAQAAFSRLIAGYFDIDVVLIWPFVAMVKGIGVGILTTTLFALPSLLAIAEVKPAWMLRKDVSGENGPARDRRSLAAGGVIILGLWGLAVWVGSSVYYASIFAAALIASILVLAGIGAVILRFLKKVAASRMIRRSAAIRHGITNLYRPGAHSPAIIASIGVGVMFTLSVYYLQHSLIEEIQLTAPPDAPNMFLINITDRERDGVVEMLEAEPAIEDLPPLSPSVSAQLATIDGTPLELIPLEEGARRYLNTQFILTWAREVPAATEILEGAWWDGDPAEPLVSVQDFAAEALGLKVNSVVEWTALRGIIRARVANIRRTDSSRVGANNQFILSPGTLDAFSAVYYGAVRVRPEAIGGIQARIFQRYPTVTVVNAADILQIVQEVMDRVTLAINFVAAFAIFGGLVVLAASVAGTRYRRMREVAILKTVGATRGTLVKMFCAEFAVIGSAAGFIGGILGVGLSAFLISELLDTPYNMSWPPVLLATLLSTIVTVAAGWLASYGVLDRKPLEILRQIET